jgi:HAD superfamily hydrolase (TIGR01509 family)
MVRRSGIRWIVFDAMGVIFTVGDDTNDLLVPFVQARNSAVTRAAINEIYLRASLGEMSSGQFWDAVGLGRDYPDIEREYLDTRLTVDPDFMPVAGRLAGRFRLGLLSNDLAEWSAYLRRTRSLSFDAVTISGDAGCRKPSPEIYRRFLAASGAAGDECVFVDDRLKNLAAAHALGFATVLFERNPERGDFAPDGRVAGFVELEAELERLSGRPDPD